MICYIYTEKREKYQQAAGVSQAKLRLEAASGLPCMVLYYADVTLDQMESLGVKACVFSGYVTMLQEHPLESFAGVYEIARQGTMPMLGLCGGHQLLAELWAPHNDKRLTKMAGYHMRKLRKGEPDLCHTVDPGWFTETGFRAIQIVKRDPLFKGLRSGFMVQEAHRNEVKKLPRDFVLLASTPDCRVQAYRHKSRTIYGTQFHPENYCDYYPAGKTVLENFFDIAGVRAGSASRTGTGQ